MNCRTRGAQFRRQDCTMGGSAIIAGLDVDAVEIDDRIKGPDRHASYRDTEFLIVLACRMPCITPVHFNSLQEGDA